MAGTSPLRRGLWALAALAILLCIYALAAAQTAPSATSNANVGGPPPPPMPLPSTFSQFSSPPGPPPGMAARPLAALLRSLEPIAAADVLITGERAPDLSAHIVLKRQWNAQLTVAQIQTIADLVVDSVSGLARDHILIVDSRGTTLYQAGQVQTVAAAPTSSRKVWTAVLVGVPLLLALAVAAVMLRRRGRRSSPAEAESLLSLRRLRDAQVCGLFAGESVHLATAVARSSDSATGRRLQRLALASAAGEHPLDGEVARVVVEAMYRKMRQIGADKLSQS